MRILNAAMLPMLLAVLVTALPSGQALAAKKFYKWQDEQGVWHYDESKPKDREAQSISVTQQTSSNDFSAASTTPIPSSTPANPATPNNPPTGTIAASDEDAEAKILANRQAACDRATQAVSMYENYARVTVDSDNDGTQELLNTEQQIARMKEARLAVKEYCN